jgi:hypothetical protein
MAAIVPDYSSTQATKLKDVAFKPLKSNEQNGRVRCAYFDYTVPAGGIAAAKTIDLVKLPKGARYLNGFLYNDGATANAVLDVGVRAADGSDNIDGAGTGDDGDFLAAGITASATTGAFFSASAPAQVGYEFQKQLWVVAQTRTAGIGAGKVIRGYVEFVTD